MTGTRLSSPGRAHLSATPPMARSGTGGPRTRRGWPRRDAPDGDRPPAIRRRTGWPHSSASLQPSASRSSVMSSIMPGGGAYAVDRDHNETVAATNGRESTTFSAARNVKVRLCGWLFGPLLVDCLDAESHRRRSADRRVVANAAPMGDPRRDDYLIPASLASPPRGHDLL